MGTSERTEQSENGDGEPVWDEGARLTDSDGRLWEIAETRWNAAVKMGDGEWEHILERVNGDESLGKLDDAIAWDIKHNGWSVKRHAEPVETDGGRQVLGVRESRMWSSGLSAAGRWKR